MMLKSWSPLPHFQSLRFRLILLVLGCILPIALVSMGLVYISYQKEQAKVSESFITRARAMVSAVDREFAKTESALTALSTSPYLAANDLRGFHAQASQVLKDINADSIAILDNSGQLLLSTQRAFGEPLPKLEKAPVLKRIIATGKPGSGTFYRGTLANVPVIVFGMPVRLGDSVTASLYVTIEPDRLSAILSEQKLPATWKAVIADPTGSIVDRTSDIKKYLGTKMAPDFIQHMERANENAYETKNGAGVTFITAYSRSPVSRWTVAMKIPLAEVMADSRHMLSWLIMATCAALVIGIALAWMIGERITRAITALVKPAAMLGSGEPIKTIPSLDFKEANEVGAALLNASTMLQQAASARRCAKQIQVYRVIEAAADPMLLVDKDGIILYSNHAVEKTFGYKGNELVGQNVDILVPLPSRAKHAQARKHFHATERPQSLNQKRPLTAAHQDGSIFPVEISLSPFQLNGQNVVIANIRDISKRKRAEELLKQSFIQLRLLSDHQRTIKEIERKRIAQDIHDELGQNLLALKMDVVALHTRTANTHPKLSHRAGIVLVNINNTIQSVKAIMNDLRPATLELGLYPAVEWQLKQFERTSGIVCTLQTAHPEDQFGLDERQTSAVFRILQESLTNVAHHAQATEVTIALIRDAHGFTMTVTDNGKGLHPGDRKKTNAFGLIGIEERIHALGGELILTSSPGNGTALSVVIAADALEDQPTSQEAADGNMHSVNYSI